MISYPGCLLNIRDMGIADRQLKYTYTEHAPKHMIPYPGLEFLIILKILMIVRFHSFGDQFCLLMAAQQILVSAVRQSTFLCSPRIANDSWPSSSTLARSSRQALEEDAPALSGARR